MSTTWVHEAIRTIERDIHRSADTHLIPLPCPGTPGVDIYIKDESTHPTGSLKHRLARSLILYGLCNGAINEDTTLVEASSGSTAVSEAYFARMLGLSFVAVMPRGTSPTKVHHIEFQGGTCHFVDDPCRVYEVAESLARKPGGYYLDQFTNAAIATDWRGNNTIAESVFEQMARERYPVPRWVVVGAGTGGTSATIGRYVRYRRFDTEVCVVDPVKSVFYEFFHHQDRHDLECLEASGIEGIGRPRVEPSFIPSVIDRMFQVTNLESYGAMHALAEFIGRKYGGSTGTNLAGTVRLAAEMHAAGERGSIVTLACDAGDRYLGTYYSQAWLAEHGYNIAPTVEEYRLFMQRGEFSLS